MAKKHYIRSELPPDKEQQPGMVKRALRQRYGFYRPVTEQSAQELTRALEVAKPEIEEYLVDARNRESPPINLQSEFGVTFVKQRRLGQQMFKALRGGFSMGRAIERLESHAIESSNVLEVEIDWDKIVWSKSKPHRKAIACFATSKALNELVQEQQIIDGVLSQLGLENIVDEPNHVTLFDYGSPGDRVVLKASHRLDILDIVADTLEEQKLGKIALLPLNIGPSYSKPCEMWKHVREPTATQPELI